MKRGEGGKERERQEKGGELEKEREERVVGTARLKSVPLFCYFYAIKARGIGIWLMPMPRFEACVTS